MPRPALGNVPFPRKEGTMCYQGSGLQTSGQSERRVKVMFEVFNVHQKRMVAFEQGTQNGFENLRLKISKGKSVKFIVTITHLPFHSMCEFSSGS